MNIQYIIPKSIATIRDELDIELSELDNHISKKDIATMNDLKVLFSSVITKPIVITDHIYMGDDQNESDYTYDGYVVTIPDSAVESIKTKSLSVIYYILNSIVEFYNKESDIDALDSVVLDNYILMKSKLKYPELKEKAYY